ncbi:MAG: NUDIX hydrolase [Candidatus Woesearchaeota archaeon]
MNMEFLDAVDENDNAIGKFSKDEIYSKKLRHRIVHVHIFNDKGEMALQLRAKGLKFCPEHWCTSVGGHVQSGESYEEAALREYKEELGAKSNIEFFSKDLYSANGLEKFVVAFKAKASGNFKIESRAIQKVEFFSIEQIKNMIVQGEKFHPELLFLLKKYFL